MKKVYLICESHKSFILENYNSVTEKKVKEILEKEKIDLKSLKISLSNLMKGIKVEFEHGKVDPQTDVTNDSLTKTLKIALAHLKEKPNYYQLLGKYVE